MKAFITEVVLMLRLWIIVIFSVSGGFDIIVTKVNVETNDVEANVTSFEEQRNQTRNETEVVCGVPFASPLMRSRIVGGQEAKRCVWSWQVSVQRLGRHSWYHTCGGSIIHARWILTAAHCIYDDRNVSNYRVLVGEFDRFQPDANEMAFSVRQLVVHENYVGIQTLWNNDIALIETDGLIPVTSCSLPICLPPADFDGNPFKCFATGWGRDIEGGKATRTLHEVELTVFSLSVCNQPTWYANYLTVNMVCAGDPAGGRGTCTGDSGGPLACVDESLQKWTVHGLTSWAKVPCAGPDSPTVFTRVSAFVPWINSHIEKTRLLATQGHDENDAAEAPAEEAEVEIARK